MNTEELVQKIIDRVGFDIFKLTRKREYVEARALLIYYLYNYYRMSHSQIAEFITKKGYRMHRTSIIHNLNNFEIYMKFSPFLRSWDSDIDIARDKELEGSVDFIREKITQLQKEDIYKVNEIVRDYWEKAVIKNHEVKHELV